VNGPEVLVVLRERGIERLYHANSVSTSCTFLRQGGLVSRGTAEANRWPQTPQYTDDVDRRYGIWFDVFVDSDDYHRRISNRNQYGPVSFALDTQFLQELPAGSEVHVTRANPTKWAPNQAYGDRYYADQAELRANLVKGTFDQMITLRIPAGILPFGQRLSEVLLDNPVGQRAGGADAFAASMQDLTVAAAQGGVVAPIRPRECNFGCRCVQTYQREWNRLRSYF
jgi:hypothetical protein